MRQSYQKKIRIYCKEKLSLNRLIKLDQKDTHYLKNVMRCKVEDTIILFNERDLEFFTKIKSLNKKQSILHIQKKTSNFENHNDIHLIFSLVKKDQVEYIIQKSTELGVKKIFPIITERSSLKNINFSRLKLIAKEACEQSERIKMPEIMNIVSLDTLIQKWNSKRKILFADEILVENKKKILLNKNDFISSALLVGPEGGFSSDENMMLKKHKFIFPITFGKGILKSDTAVVVGLSYLNFINSFYQINHQ